MQFLLMVYQDRELYEALDDGAWHALKARHRAFYEALKDAGQLIAARALRGTERAKTVRPEALVTDGPFAETKEYLGGFYMIEVPSREEAVAIAARCPGATIGSIEVRPVQDKCG